MRHSTRSIICLVTIVCLGIAASLAMAHGRLINVTVSFDAWQTSPPVR